MLSRSILAELLLLAAIGLRLLASTLPDLHLLAITVANQEAIDFLKLRATSIGLAAAK